MRSNTVPEQRQVWDEEYSSKGRLWRGASSVPHTSHGLKVLELGCGNGKTLIGAADSAASLVGLDHSMQALRACPSGPDLVLGDAAHIPFRDDVFDMVWCVHVLGHMTYDLRLSTAVEVARVLRPGGKVWFRDFHVTDIRNGQGDQIGTSTFVRGRGLVYHYFEIDEIGDLFPEARILDIRVDTLKKPYHGQGQRAEVDAILQL